MTSKKQYKEWFEKAKAEGRICAHCGNMIAKSYWKVIKDQKVKFCANCEDALRGVRTNRGTWAPSDDSFAHQ